MPTSALATVVILLVLLLQPYCIIFYIKSIDTREGNLVITSIKATAGLAMQ